MFPSHFTTEIGRMRAEEMRARAERYRLAKMGRRHHEDSKPEEKPLTRSRVYVYRKALGIVALALLVAVGIASAALAMPLNPPPDGGGSKDAVVSQPPVREGPPSYWEAQQQASTQFVRTASERAWTQQGLPDSISDSSEPAPGVTSSSGGIDLEIVLLSGILALTAVGALLWFRRHRIKVA